MTLCKRQILVWICCCISFLVNAQEGSPLTKDSTGILNSIAQNILRNKEDTSLIVIADITINGNKRTKAFVIEREIPFKQGDYISVSELEKKLILAQQQIMNISLFTNVSVFIHSRQAGLVFINIDVKERWYFFPLPYFKLVDRNFNQWWVEQKASQP